MNLRKCLYNLTGLQLPTSEPLWDKDEGLDDIVKDNGDVEQLPTPKVEIKEVPKENLTDQQYRKFLFDTMVIRENITDQKGRVLVSNVPLRVKNIANSIFDSRARYQSISGHFSNPIRWFHVGLIHKMEGNLNFGTYLGNGQSLYKKTTKVPKGRGPFKDFKAGAIDAIQYDKLDLVKDWSIGNTLYVLEGFNGYGYPKYKGINSPYLWSGSNHYTSGYYVADGVYDKNTVSQQIGIALVYQEILKRL